MSSPDRIPAGQTKPERERRVFSFFAADASKYAGLTVRDGTINSREFPEPDILCDVVGEGAVAFEMTEILDQRSKQVMATMMSARETLIGHFHAVADDVHGDDVRMPTDLETAIRHVSILSPRPPFIDIALKLSIADKTTAAVTRKLTGKQYVTAVPIELLVYAHDQP
jgi:hypothetical protein